MYERFCLIAVLNIENGTRNIDDEIDNSAKPLPLSGSAVGKSSGIDTLSISKPLPTAENMRTARLR